MDVIQYAFFHLEFISFSTILNLNRLTMYYLIHWFKSLIWATDCSLKVCEPFTSSNYIDLSNSIENNIFIYIFWCSASIFFWFFVMVKIIMKKKKKKIQRCLLVFSRKCCLNFWKYLSISASEKKLHQKYSENSQ